MANGSVWLDEDEVQELHLWAWFSVLALSIYLVEAAAFERNCISYLVQFNVILMLKLLLEVPLVSMNIIWKLCKKVSNVVFLFIGKSQ